MLRREANSLTSRENLLDKTPIFPIIGRRIWGLEDPKCILCLFDMTGAVKLYYRKLFHFPGTSFGNPDGGFRFSGTVVYYRRNVILFVICNFFVRSEMHPFLVCLFVWWVLEFNCLWYFYSVNKLQFGSFHTDLIVVILCVIFFFWGGGGSFELLRW